MLDTKFLTFSVVVLEYCIQIIKHIILSPLTTSEGRNSAIAMKSSQEFSYMRTEIISSVSETISASLFRVNDNIRTI
jgi:hypothetical protein